MKNHFPFFEKNKGIYFDSAASSQRLNLVLKKANELEFEYSNIHRGAYRLSLNLSQKFEESKSKIKEYFSWNDDVLFHSGTTFGINAIAFGLDFDSVLVTRFEHHANFIPWQEKMKRTNGKFFISDSLNSEDLVKDIFSKQPKVVAVSAASNVTGIKLDLNAIASACKKVGAFLVVDGAQFVSSETNFDSIQDVDAFVFSAHKLYGPLGLGVTLLKKEFKKMLNPFVFGGAMIEDVFDEFSIYSEANKLEAGTPSIVPAIAFSEVFDFLKEHLPNRIESLNTLTEEAQKGIESLGFEIVGKEARKYSKTAFLVSFFHPKIHHLDLAMALDQFGDVQVRSGHHCAIPLHRFFNLTGSVRLSFGIYNSFDELEVFFKTLKKAKEVLL